jgi:predicted DNA-binding protein (MmcQ/YjbR family)
MTSLQELEQDHSPAIRQLAEETRRLVLSVQPQAYQQVETSWGGYLLFKQVAGAGSTVCWLTLSKKHVSLGFPNGTELSDPSGLLQGTGKRQRHLKFKQAADLANPAVRGLIEQAWSSQPAASVLQDALERIRAICLKLPGSQEKISHGHPTFFTRKRSYAVYGLYSPSVAFKPAPAQALALAQDERFFPTPYLANKGWLSLRLDDQTDWDLVQELLEGSYGQA